MIMILIMNIICIFSHPYLEIWFKFVPHLDGNLTSVCYLSFTFQDFAMRYWRDKGTPVEKLNMGFATYGRTFRLSTQSSGVGAPTSGPATAGTFTREGGFWSYYEVKLKTTSCI